MAGSIPASATAEGLAPAPWRLAGRALRRRPDALIGGALLGVVMMAALAAPLIAPYDPFAPIGPSLAPPSAEHWMGTDALGRDLFSGVVFGARTSLGVAGAVGVMVLVIGVAVGLVAGYRGGWIDDLLMRFTEILQVLPRFFLALIVIALFGPGLDRLILVLGLTSWSLLARVMRAEILSLKEREFVEASVANGASATRILLREILPNALPSAIVMVALLLAQVMLLEANLGFLGLGDPNAISWGYLAGQAQRFFRVGWWLSVFPGLAILLTVLGLNLLGDALNETLGGRT